MLKLISLAIALAFASPAIAQECFTLDNAMESLKEGGVPDNMITISEDVGFISAYHKALNLDIPDDSQPTKFIMAVIPPLAIIAIVEPDNCIKHHARISLDRHQFALMKSDGI